MIRPSSLIPCVIYAAKSTEDKKGSIPTQLADCRAMAEREGWDVVGEFQDEAFSAYSGDRGPGLAKAMADAERRTPCVLVVQHSDRLARGDARQARHLVEIITWGAKVGVTIRSVQDDFFTDPRMDLVMGALMGMRNAEDSARKSAAVKAGVERRTRAGKPWGEPAYGYRRGKDGHWAKDPGEAGIVERIFRERVKQGRSLNAIAKRLQQEKVPTRRGTNWTATQIRRILAAPAVRGQFKCGGTWHDGEHPPIIDAETFDAARALGRGKRDYAKEGRTGRLPKLHAFAHGMLRCGECGEAMLPRSEGDCYVCRTQRKLGGGCSMPKQRRPAVDGTFLETFEQVSLDLEETRRLVAEQGSAQLSETEAQASGADREVSRLRSEAARVDRDYRSGKLGAENHERLSAAIAEELRAAEAESSRLREHVEAVRAVAADLDGESETLRMLGELRAAIAGKIESADAVEALRAAIASIFESVEIVANPAIPSGFYLAPRVRSELIGPDGDVPRAVLGIQPNKLSGTHAPQVPAPAASASRSTTRPSPPIPQDASAR